MTENTGQAESTVHERDRRTSAIDLSRAPSTGILINGEWRQRDDTFPVLDKFVQLPSAYVSTAGPDDLADAVNLAKEFTGSHTLPGATRALILERTAELVERHREQFAQMLAVEGGFTSRDANGEVSRAVTTLRICAVQATQFGGRTAHFGATLGADARTAFTRRFPLGLVCAITPFNSPLNVVLHKIGPAIAAGNAAILKPSPHAPLTAGLVCQLLLEAGLPPQLISVVNSSKTGVVEQLLAEPRIDFYAFTGSTAVGRVIAQGAGIRRSQLELGSISSTIICRSAQLEVAIPKVANAAFRKAGQVCTSTQRLYIAREVFNEAATMLAAKVTELRVGDPLDADVSIGPMISSLSVDRVSALVGRAVQRGATLITGGIPDGTLFPPTILTDVLPEDPILHQEIFGPVVCLIPFDNFGAAIDAANDTPFGLSCGVFTNNVSEVNEAMVRLRFGSVHINEASSARVDEMPFGGVKDSGRGLEGPRYAIQEMTEERLITINPL